MYLRTFGKRLKKLNNFNKRNVPAVSRNLLSLSYFLCCPLHLHPEKVLFSLIHKTSLPFPGIPNPSYLFKLPTVLTSEQLVLLSSAVSQNPQPRLVTNCTYIGACPPWSSSCSSPPSSWGVWSEPGPGRSRKSWPRHPGGRPRHPHRARDLPEEGWNS